MKTFYKIVDWLLVLVLAIMLIQILIVLSGCAALQKTVNPVPSTPSQQIINNVIHSTDWLGSLFLLGFVCSVIGAGLGFKKLGIVCALSCISGLFLKSALSTLWFYQAAALIVLASILIVIAGIIYKNRAIVELILGIQKVKESNHPYVTNNGESELNKVEVNNTLQSVQTKLTRKLVSQIKNDLKLKGKIT